MPRRKYRVSHPSGHYVREGQESVRACNRPDRVPGVAPACEDDKIVDRRERNARAPVSLPKLKCLEPKEQEMKFPLVLVALLLTLAYLGNTRQTDAQRKSAALIVAQPWVSAQPAPGGQP